MGFVKRWDVAEITSQIHTMARECSSGYNDGFVTFEIKKDLYQLQETINQALKNCPNYGDLEKDWLHKQEQQRIIKLLKE